MQHTHWLKRAKLGGYKSIQDTEITFRSGLNIIIGRNGSGKTNFFEFLYNSLIMKFAGVSDFFCELELVYSQDEQDKPTYTSVKIKGEKKIQNDVFHQGNKIKLIVKGIVVIGEGTPMEFIKNIMEDSDDVFFSQVLDHIPARPPIKIDYAIPSKIKSLDEPIVLDMSNAIINTYYPRNDDFLGMLTQFAEQSINSDGTFNIKQIENKLSNSFDKLNASKSVSKLRIFLQKFTEIEDVRLNQGIRILEKNGYINFTNIINEFKIQDNWYFFNDLSDGTKRLVYIIFTLILSTAKTILLEEPELGIHPHQLELLMQFLKEQAENKQIIITTHAPQCLDILGADELDSIIIAEMTDEGTKLSHLDEKRKEKAAAYMQDEDTLSNYWRFSDLEPRIKKG